MKKQNQPKKRQHVLKLGFSIVIFLLAVVLTTPALAAKDYHAISFDVWADIEKDGSLVVTETINFRFDGGPFTYVFREISRNGTDNIAIMDASMDGIPFPSGTNAGQVEIINGNPLKVTWHFAPTSDSSHEFVLRYRVLGAIRAGNADTLIWRAIPETHDYSIAQSSISITYPVGVHPLKAPSLDHLFDAVPLDNGYRLTTVKLDADVSAVLTIQFISGSLASQPPAWQALQDQKNRQIRMALPYGLGTATLIGFLGLLLVVLMGRSFHRETTNYSDVAQNFSTPPRPLSPALAARLIGSSTFFLGTLFDLAQRGVLLIEEGPKKWGSRTFIVIRKSIDEQLQPYEQVFIGALFRKAKNDQVPLTSISSLAYNTSFTKLLDRELADAGWRDSQRSLRRQKFLVASGLALSLGAAILLAGLLLGGFSLVTNSLAVIIGAVLIGIGAAASIMGLVGLMVAALVSTLSEQGRQQALVWKSFAGYLRNITRGRETTTSPDTFERYLSYAASFGIATEWVKYFQKLPGIPVPEWFQGLQSSVEDGSFVALMSAITAADSSASAASGAGAGGASGGGSSGAG